MTCNVAGQLKKSRSLQGMDKDGEMNAGHLLKCCFATIKAGWSEAVVNYYNLNEHTAAFPSFELLSPSKTTKIIIQVKLSSHYRFKLRSTRINVLCYRQPTLTRVYVPQSISEIMLQQYLKAKHLLAMM